MLRLRRPHIHIQKRCVSQPLCLQCRSIFNLVGFPFSSNPNSGNKYHERKILPYGQSQLYNVVADVESYHRFLPYCVSSRVLSKSTSKSADGTQDILKMQGKLTVGFMGYEESYISNVDCRPHEMVQAVASSDIPLFKSLITTWGFQPASSSSPHPTGDIVSSLHRSATEDGPTLVTLDLEYEFANPIYAQLSSAFFSQVSKMTVQAFERRCLELYGPGTR